MLTYNRQQPFFRKDNTLLTNDFEKETLTKKEIYSGAKMALTETEKYMARRKLELNGGMGALVYFSTIWGSEHILIMFNTIDKYVFNVICNQELSEEDIDLMEELLHDYIMKELPNDYKSL